MNRFFIIIISVLITGSAYAEITNWWGVVSFRQRNETAKLYTDFTQAGDAGTLRYTEDNFKTRVGYQFGFNVDIADNLAASLTFRSGLGSVMLQDITSSSGLTPGLQEAYIDWETPYARLHMGKIPQQGNAMWDLYAGANQTDWRLYNPADGLFNDRMSALNGARLMVPLEFAGAPITLRATFHSDNVSGRERDYDDSALEDEKNPDWYVMLLGFNAQYDGYELDADFGIPKRLGEERAQGTKDSIYVDEVIWGATASKTVEKLDFGGISINNSKLSLGYGFNDRDSVFTANFYTVLAQTEILGYRFSAKFDKGVHESKEKTYAGSKAHRQAMHFYVNKTIWNLDLQPRIILFKTEIENEGVTKVRDELTRIELTATVKF